MNFESKTKVRYAVIGAGNIAQVAVLPAFKHAKDNSELVAILSSDRTKRDVLKKKYELELDGDYSELEAVIERGKIDAVYIATPNATHKSFALRAARAGVHVLCEKPLGGTLADAEAIVRGCEESNVKLMVAYRLHFDAGTLTVLERLTNGYIGDPMVFSSTFSHVVRPGDIRVSAEDGGGATLDLGVYCINAARHIFKAEPIAVSAVSVKKNGVDDTTSATLQFSRGRIAQFTVSNSVASVSNYRVLGTEGDISVEPAYEYAEGFEYYITLDSETAHESFSQRDQFAPELLHFSDCILNNREPKPSGEEGLADMRVVDAILTSASEGQMIMLEAEAHTYHPTLSQRIDRPAVGKQSPVHAPSASLK